MTNPELAMTLRQGLAAIVCCACAAMTACSDMNNPFSGEISADLGQNRVIIQGCTLWGMPKVVDLPDGGKRFAPCKNTVVVIEGGRVSLNGEDVGTVQPHDTVLVRDGHAQIQSQNE
jgi:hypothetical protein